VFNTNHDEDDRAKIPHGVCDSVVNDATQLSVSVDNATLPPDVQLMDVEVKGLRDMLDAWIIPHKEKAAAVVDLASEEGGDWDRTGADGNGGGGDGDGENWHGYCWGGDGNREGGGWKAMHTRRRACRRRLRAPYWGCKQWRRPC